MKVYLDTCCYGRPFDDRTQKAINDEAVAVMTAVDVCQILGHTLVGSHVVKFELDNISNVDRRNAVENFFDDSISEFLDVSTDDIAAKEKARAVVLHTQGIGAMDSYHLAIAEMAGVDVLLTTDKNFLKIAAKIDTPVKVISPLNFLPEATK